jgi:hypothetical protein
MLDCHTYIVSFIGFIITHSTESILSGEIMVSLLSMNGQKIRQARFGNQAQDGIDVSDLAEGIYYVKIQTNAGIYTKKMVIQQQ